MISPFIQRGGIHVGNSYFLAYNATWPFVVITIDDKSIRIEVSATFLSQIYIFDRSSITRLSEYKGLFSGGLRIEHTNAEYPPFVVFWSFRLRLLREALEKRGYEVIRSKKRFFQNDHVS